MSSTFAFGIARPELLEHNLQVELEDVFGAIQTQGNSIGRVKTVPRDQAVTTASGSMTWTLNTDESQFIYLYTIIGTMMHLSFQINTSTVGGTASNVLKLLLPNGVAGRQGAGRIYMQPMVLLDGGVVAFGRAFVECRPGFSANDPRFVQFVKQDASNWTLGTVGVFGQLWFEVDA